MRSRRFADRAASAAVAAAGARSGRERERERERGGEREGRRLASTAGRAIAADQLNTDLDSYMKVGRGQ